MSRIWALALVAPFLLVPARAQQAEQEPSADLRKEIEDLKKGQLEIQKQLQEIRRLLQTRQPAPARAEGPNVRGTVIEIGDDPQVGENTAPLTLVEFTDYQ